MAKKIPMRMCVSCREMKPKKELTRVVRTPEETVLLDTSGRANGRGAYLCRKSACLEKAIKSRALERALEVSIPPETYETLREQFAGYEQQQAE